MRRKIIVILITVLMSFSCLSACGSQDAELSDGLWRADYSEEYIAEILERLNISTYKEDPVDGFYEYWAFQPMTKEDFDTLDLYVYSESDPDSVGYTCKCHVYYRKGVPVTDYLETLSVLDNPSNSTERYYSIMGDEISFYHGPYIETYKYVFQNNDTVQLTYVSTTFTTPSGSNTYHDDMLVSVVKLKRISREFVASPSDVLTNTKGFGIASSLLQILALIGCIILIKVDNKATKTER